MKRTTNFVIVKSEVATKNDGVAETKRVAETNAVAETNGVAESNKVAEINEVTGTNETEAIGAMTQEEILEIVNMSDVITMLGSDNIIVVRHIQVPTQMTTLEVIQTIEGFEDILSNLYSALMDSCSVEDGCSDCECCSGFSEDNITPPDWAMEDAGLAIGTKLCISVEEGSGVIMLEPVGYDHDITDVSEEMLEHLVEIGICRFSLNESIIKEEIIYEY